MDCCDYICITYKCFELKTSSFFFSLITCLQVNYWNTFVARVSQLLLTKGEIWMFS